MARGADFDLAKELAKPSFTPGQRDAPQLVALVLAGEDAVVARASAALARLGEAGRRAIEEQFAEADEPGAARLTTALGLFARAQDAAARAALLRALADSRVRVRRAAIVALGKLGADAGAGGSDAEAGAALVARWDAADVTPDERRALAEALGKLGGDAALARLRALDGGADRELVRRRDRALLMAERSAKRTEESSVATDVPPLSPLAIRLHCRAGLGELLAEELRERGLLPPADARGRGLPPPDDARERGLLPPDDARGRGLLPSNAPGRPRGEAAGEPHAGGDAFVDVVIERPWSALFASRLWTSAGIRVPLASGGDEATRIVRTITSPPVRTLLRAWTRGAIRWRLAFPSGHRRSVVWQVARDVAAAAPELVNDPTSTTWDVLVDGEVLELEPRRAEDPRFAWRVADVPAASHPTVAAALAYVAGARDGDRVWDPFVGSGAELVERARLGPTGALTGSDLSDDALAAARANLAQAGVTATLVRADARTHAVGPVDLILTNPPLGSRVQLDAAQLLALVLPHFAAQLAPGGRLVWITPSSRKTSPVAERAGLRRVRALAVDLGGVRGTLERWER